MIKVYGEKWTNGQKEIFIKTPEELKEMSVSEIYEYFKNTRTELGFNGFGFSGENECTQLLNEEIEVYKNQDCDFDSLITQKLHISRKYKAYNSPRDTKEDTETTYVKVTQTTHGDNEKKTIIVSKSIDGYVI